MEQLTIQINSIEDVVREIDNCHLKAFTAMIELGYILRKADDAQLFRERGYSSIFEFAKDTYGWDQSKTSRYMEINRQYSVDGYSTELLPQYEGYGPAKLSEMLTLPEVVREEIGPEMKREEIREIKREYKAAEQEQKENVFAGTVELEPTEHGVLAECVENILGQDAFRKKFEDIFEQMKLCEAGDPLDEENVMFSVSGGVGTTRAGSALVFWKKDNFKILKGSEKGEYLYSELIKVAVGISSTLGKTAEDWYKEVYKRPLKEKMEPVKESKPKPVAQKTTKKTVSPAEKCGFKQSDTEPEQEERVELPGQTNFEEAEMEKLPSFAPAHKKDDPPAETVEKVEGEVVETPHLVPRVEKTEEKEDLPAENMEKPGCFCAEIGNELKSNDGTFTLIHGKDGVCRIERGIYNAILEMQYCPVCGKEMVEE